MRAFYIANLTVKSEVLFFLGDKNYQRYIQMTM